MAFDATHGGEPHGRMCRSCRHPIAPGEASETISFDNDPDRKLNDLNGLYHARCARPFLSLARIINMDAWGR